MESERAKRARLQRQEDFYARSPGLYRLRLYLMAGLAQAILGLAGVLVAGAMLALLLQLVTQAWDPRRVIALIVVGLLASLLGRALFVKLEPPQGYRLAEGEAARLREEIERIRTQVHAAPLHAIVIDERLNAAAALHVSGLPFARGKQYLVLGLPLLHLLDTAELSSVIAHEFGHFHRDHGGFATWVYRLRVRLHVLAEHALSQNLASQWVLGRLAQAFSHRFDEQSRVIARQQELAADAQAARVAGATATASALVRVRLAAEHLTRDLWPEIERTALAQNYPPAHVLARLHESLAQARAYQGRPPAWLLDQRGDPDDTHPGLRQRLEAVGVAAELELPPAAASAASQWLEGPVNERIQTWLEQRWQDAHRAQWLERHAQAREGLRRLEELEQQTLRSADDWLELAELAQTHRPHLDVAGYYRQGLQHSPNHAVAQLRLGSWLLSQGQDLAGAGDALERAGQLQPALLPQALDTLERHLRHATASPPSLRALMARLQAASERHGEDLPEHEEDEFSPATLDEPALQLIRRALAGQSCVARAWLLRQASHRDSVLPHHVLLLEWHGSVAREKATLPRLSRQLAVPGTLAIQTTTERTASVRRLQRHLGEPLYQRR